MVTKMCSGWIWNGEGKCAWKTPQILTNNKGGDIMSIRNDTINDLTHLEWRLYKRLARLGYRLQHGITVIPVDHCRRLKKHPAPLRGYRITNIVSGKVLSGHNFDLSLSDVDQFWAEEYNKRIVDRRKKRRQAEKSSTSKSDWWADFQRWCNKR